MKKLLTLLLVTLLVYLVSVNLHQYDNFQDESEVSDQFYGRWNDRVNTDSYQQEDSDEFDGILNYNSNQEFIFGCYSRLDRDGNEYDTTQDIITESSEYNLIGREQDKSGRITQEEGIPTVFKRLRQNTNS